MTEGFPTSSAPRCAQVRTGSAAQVAAGRAMVDGLEHIDDDAQAHTAWESALCHNPESAAPIWAAVLAQGGLLRPRRWPALVCDPALSQRLLEADGRLPVGTGPAARMAAAVGGPSHFLRRPDAFLAAQEPGALFGLAHAATARYLARRAGGRDVHGSMIVDALLVEVAAHWLGPDTDIVRAPAVVQAATGLARHALCLVTDGARSAEAGRHARALHEALHGSRATALEAWWQRALGRDDRARARAAAIDTLASAAGPIAEGALRLLDAWLESGDLLLLGTALRGVTGSERHEALLQAVALASRNTPSPELLGLRAGPGVDPRLADHEPVVLGLTAALGLAAQRGAPIQLPWLGAGPDQQAGAHLIAGMFSALFACERLARSGPLQLRFERVAAITLPPQARQRGGFRALFRRREP